MTILEDMDLDMLIGIDVLRRCGCVCGWGVCMFVCVGVGVGV